MAGARQNNSQEFIANLSKKIEKMMDTSADYNEESINLLSSIENKINKMDISVELKKHTVELKNISSILKKSNSIALKLDNAPLIELLSNQYGVLLNVYKLSKLSLDNDNQSINLLGSIDNRLRQNEIPKDTELDKKSINLLGSIYNSLKKTEIPKDTELDKISINLLRSIEDGQRNLISTELKNSILELKNISSILEKNNSTVLKLDNAPLIELLSKKYKVLSDVYKLSKLSLDNDKQSINILSSIDSKIQKSNDTDASDKKISDIFKSIDTSLKNIDNNIYIGVKEQITILEKVNSSINNSGKATENVLKENIEIQKNLSSKIESSSISEAFLKSQEKNYGVLLSIDNKLGEQTGRSGGSSSGGFMSSLAGLPDILSKLVKTLMLAGLLNDLVIDGARAVVDSIKEFLNLSTKLNPATVAISLLYYKAMAKVDFGSIAAGLKSFSNIKVLIGSYILGYIAEPLSKFGLAIPTLFLLGLIPGEKISKNLTWLGEGIKNLVDNLLSIFKNIEMSILLKTWFLVKSIKMLLNMSKDVIATDALLSIGFITLLAKSPLVGLVENLKTIDFKFFGFDLVVQSHSLRRSVRTLLSLSEGMSMSHALFSVGYYKLLSEVPFNKLTENLTFDIGMLGFLKIRIRAKALRDASRYLLSTADGIKQNTAILSLLYFKLLSFVDLEKLTNNLMLDNKFSMTDLIFGNRLVSRSAALSMSAYTLLDMSNGLNPFVGFNSLLFYKLLTKTPIKEFADTLNSIKFKFFGIGLISRVESLVESGRILLEMAEPVKLTTGLLSLGFYKLLAYSDIGKYTEELSRWVGLLVFINPSKLVERATALRTATKILLRTSSRLPLKDALLSIGYYKLLAYSDLGKYTESLNTFIGVWIWGKGSKLIERATALSEATKILLRTSKRLDWKDSLLSIGYYKLLAYSDLGKYTESLNTFIGVWIWGKGSKLVERATALSAATKILLKTSSKIPFEVASTSVAYFKILASSNLEGYTKALSSSFGFFGMGSRASNLVKRANGLKDATRILLTVSQGIDWKTALVSLGIMVLISYSVDKLRKGLVWTAMLSPLIFIGIHVITFAITKLIGSINEVNKSGKDIIALGIFMFSLSFSISSIIFACMLAAVTAPLTITGAFVMQFLVKKLSSFVTSAEKLGVQSSGALEKLIALVSIMEMFSTISDLMTKKIKAKDALASVGIFALAILAIGGSVALLTKMYASINADIFDVIGASISALVGAVTSMLISKALKDPQKSLKDVLVFALMTAVISGTVYLFSKASEGISAIKMMAIVVFVGAMIFLTDLVVRFARGLGFKAIGEVLMFNFITATLVFGMLFITNRAETQLGAVIKLVGALILWVGTLVLISLALKYFIRTVTIADVVGVALIIGGLSLMMKFLSKELPEIKQGAKALFFMSLGIISLIPSIMLFKAAGITGMDALGIGILVLSITLAIKFAGDDLKKVMKGSLAIAIAGLSIIALIPAVAIFKASGVTVSDAISISLVILGIGVSFALVGKMWESIAKGSLAVATMSIALSMLSIGLFIFKASGSTILDALSVALSVLVLGTAFWIVGKGWDTIILGSLAVFGMTLAIGMLSIGLWYFKQTKFELKDILTLGLTVIGLGIAFWMVGKGWDTILKGAFAILSIGAAIWVLSNGMKVWKKSNVQFSDISTIAGTIAAFGVEFGIVGNFYIPILKGALAIAGLGTALWVLSHGMKTWTNAKVKMSDVGVLGATIAMLGVEFGIVGLGPVPIAILSGALAIAGLGASLWVVSHGMKIWTSAKTKISDVGVLGATIAMLGVEFAAAGLASPLILSGSFALGAASIPLLAITGALKVFAISKFTKEDGDNLSYALQSVIDGFLGGKMPGGFLAGLSYAAKSAARIALMIPSIPVIMGAAAALVPISKSILTFKKSGFVKEDGSNLEYMISSVIKGFGLLGDKKRQKELGVSFDKDSIKSSIGILTGAGKVLSGLAEGIRAWANLEIIEWDIIHPGTSKAKFVVSGKRKLNKTDFENAAYGMSKVISAIGEPLAKLGRLQKGQSTGDPYLDKIYSGNFVTEGIKSLAGIGSIMSSLASGVKDFSSMQFTEYEVVNAGTSKAKLVPKLRRKLTDAEVEGAGRNIGKILSVVGYQFAKIGRKESSSEGDWPWSGGWVSKGIDSLKGISEILGSVTKGVVSMVYNEIPTFELINGGTSKAKLVPGKSIKVSDADLEKASHNIGKILSIIAYQFAKIGKNEANSEGAFSGGWVSKGVKSLSGVSSILKSVIETVSNIAYGTFSPMELVNAGTPNAKLVPGTPIKFTPKTLIDAGKTIGNILNAIGKSFVHFGYYINKNQENFDISIESVSKISEPIKSMIGFTNEFLKIKDPLKIAGNIKKVFDKINSIFPKNNINSLKNMSKAIELYSQNMVNLGDSATSITKFALSIAVFERLKNPKAAANDISSFISIINANFDVNKNRNLKNTMDNMGMFTTNITNIAKKADPLEKAAKNMDKIQKSMKLMKDSINSMDLKKLTLTDAMLNSMAHLSKNPEAMARSIEKSLNASFKALIKALKENTGAKTSGGGGGDGGAKTGGDSGAKTLTTDTGTTDKNDVKKESNDKNKTGMKNDSDIFAINAKNQDMYQAMVEALNDVVIRTVAVGSNDYSRK